MSHIQQFFHQYLPEYYIQTITPQLDNPNFLSTSNPHNIFNLTADLILSAQKCIKITASCSMQDSVALDWIISYNSLQKVNLPEEQNDNRIVTCFKKKLNYVHVQMLQILVRLIICVHECQKRQINNYTIQKYIEEISYIYPALKIQVSFSHTQIDLVQWFDSILHRIATKIDAKDGFKKILESVVEKCGMMGAIERVFARYSKIVKNDNQNKDSESKPLKTVSMSEIRPIKQQPILINATSQRQQSASCEKKSNFDEFQLFRKKKKIIIKERLRPGACEPGCKTPIQKQHREGSISPTTEPTVSLSIHSDTTQNNASSLLYRKLKNNNSRPVSRTLFYNQTKKFVPKKTPVMDPENFLQMMTAPSFEFVPSGLLGERKFSRMTQKAIVEDDNVFGVPETPKKSDFQNIHKKSIELLRKDPFSLQK